MLQQVPDLIRLGCYRTVWQFTKHYLKDDRLRRAFSIQPLLVVQPVLHQHLLIDPLPRAPLGRTFLAVALVSWSRRWAD